MLLQELLEQVVGPLNHALAEKFEQKLLDELADDLLLLFAFL